jgi:hypothetical protein
MKFLVLMSFFSLFSVNAINAQELKVPSLKNLNGHKVLFQSPDLVYVASKELFKTRVILRWGTQVHEVGDAYFTCRPTRQSPNVQSCKFAEFVRRGFFETCQPAKNPRKFSCRKRLKPSSSNPQSDYQRPGYWGYWERHEDDSFPERNNGRRNSDDIDGYGYEFPSRNQESSDWETGGIVLF